MAKQRKEAQAAIDRSKDKLRELHQVTGWILYHWDEIPDDLYRMHDNQFVPYSVRRLLLKLARRDASDALAVIANWREFLEEEEGEINREKPG